MPACIAPETAGMQHHWAIELDEGYRGSSDRRQAHDANVAMMPTKMLSPLLVVWVKKTNPGAGLRIDGRYAIAFDEVTIPTR